MVLLSGFLDNTGARDPQVLEKVLEKIPAGRLGEVEEAAHLAASLLDGECSFMNGEFLSVSGGWTRTSPGLDDWTAGTLTEDF